MKLTDIYDTGSRYAGERAVSTLQGQALLLCIIPGLSENELLPHKWCVISQSYHLAALLGLFLCAMKANKGRSSSAS